MKLQAHLGVALLALAPHALAQEEPASPAAPSAPASAATPPAEVPEEPAPPPAEQPTTTAIKAEDSSAKASSKPAKAEHIAPKTPPKPAEAKDTAPEPPPKPHDFAVFAGVRTVFVRRDGYEPFAKRPLFWSASLGGNVVVSRQGPLTLALGGALDLGRTDSSVRQSDTRLSTQRLTLGPEIRHALSRRFSATGHVGVGGGRLTASYDDRVVSAELVDKRFFFTADAGAGVSFLIGAPRTHRPAFFITVEGGYLYSPRTRLELTSGKAPARSAPLELPDLSLSGPYTRVYLTLTF